MSDLRRPLAELGSSRDMDVMLVARYLDSKSHATSALSHPSRMVRARTETNLSRNLRYLLRTKNWSEAELSRRSGVAQKTVNNAVNGVYQTKVETCEQLAKPFGLTGWLLIHPKLIDNIEGGSTITKLIQAYMNSSEEGQRVILGIAEREAAYRGK